MWSKLWMGFPVDWAYFCSLSKFLLFLLHLPLPVFAKQHILSPLALTHICTVEHLNDGFTPRFEIRLTTVAESWMRFFSAVISNGEAHEVYKVFNVAMVSCAKYKLPEVCHYHLLRLQTSNVIKWSLKEVSSSNILISPVSHQFPVKVLVVWVALWVNARFWQGRSLCEMTKMVSPILLLNCLISTNSSPCSACAHFETGSQHF